MSLKRGIFYTFLTQAPTLVLYFISNIFLTRVLGDEGRGAYALVMNESTLLSMALGLNLVLGINYFVSQEKGKPDRMVRVATTALVFNLIMAPLFLACTFKIPVLNKIFLPPASDHWSGFLFLFLFATVIIAQVNSWISAIVLALKKFATLNRMSIFSAATPAIGYTILFFNQHWVEPHQMIQAVLVVALLASTVNLAVWAWIYVRIVGLPPIPTFNWAVLQPVLSLSMVGYLTNLVNLINYRFDIWVVGSYAGTAALGLYATAVGVSQMLFYIPEPFSKVLQPYLYRGIDQGMLERFKFIARLNFTTVTVLSLTLGVIAYWLVPILYGNVFAGAVLPLIILLPGIIFMCIYKLFVPFLIEGGLIRFNLYATSASAVATIVLDLLLIPRFGILGAAVASTLAYLVLFLVQSTAIRKQMGIPLKDMFLIDRADIARIKQIAKGSLPI